MLYVKCVFGYMYSVTLVGLYSSGPRNDILQLLKYNWLSAMIYENFTIT